MLVFEKKRDAVSLEEERCCQLRWREMLGMEIEGRCWGGDGGEMVLAEMRDPRVEVKRCWCWIWRRDGVKGNERCWGRDEEMLVVEMEEMLLFEMRGDTDGGDKEMLGMEMRGRCC